MDTGSKKQQGVDLPLVVGLLLATLGGITAIGVGIFVTSNASYLWALILLMWGVEHVRKTRRKYEWKPAVIGLVMGLLYVGLGVVVYFVKDANYLCAMLLVIWLTDEL